MVRYPCPSCSGPMVLEPVHEGHEVPCPHCGARFLVPPGAATPAPAAPGPTGLPVVPDPVPPQSAAAGMVFTLGLLAVLGVVTAPFCYVTLILVFAGPVAWVIGQREIRKVKAAGRTPDGLLTAGWVLGIVASALLALGCMVAAVAAAAAAFVTVGESWD